MLKINGDMNARSSQVQCLYTNLAQVEIPCSWNPLNGAQILSWEWVKFLGGEGKGKKTC